MNKELSKELKKQFGTMMKISFPKFEEQKYRDFTGSRFYRLDTGLGVFHYISLYPSVKDNTFTVEIASTTKEQCFFNNGDSAVFPFDYEDIAAFIYQNNNEFMSRIGSVCGEKQDLWYNISAQHRFGNPIEDLESFEKATFASILNSSVPKVVIDENDKEAIRRAVGDVEMRINKYVLPLFNKVEDIILKGLNSWKEKNNAI